MPDKQNEDQIQNPAVAPSAEGVPESPSLNEAVDANKENVSQHMDQLEVEEMDESRVWRQRSETKERLRNLGTEPTETGEPVQAFGEDGGLMAMLKEANLSSRHLRFCCGGLVLVLLAVGAVWGGLRFWDYWQDRPTESLEVIETVDEPADSPAPLDESEDETGYHFFDPSIWAGLTAGYDEPDSDLATGTGEFLGSVVNQEGLEELIAEFGDMYEIMQVNVTELLDQSRDRQDTLDDYHDELSYLLARGRNNLEELQLHNENIEQAYSDTESLKDDLEEEFFDELRNIDAIAAVDTLEDFIDEGQEIVRLRAHYQAREKLIDYHELLIANMEARLSDIELNEEALVLGIQVVDITGSDIELIIDEVEL